MINNNDTTACPLDCYDACEIVYDKKIKAYNGAYNQGFVWPHLNHYEKNEQIKMPRYMGKEISMDEALLKLKEILSKNRAEDTLLYRGSGNFALMQKVSEHFFASFKATLSDGNLCDGAGEAGIVEGRGSNKNMPLCEIAKSEVVILWGRNPHTTSSHLLPLIKDKKIIVIDPVKTQIAKSADLYIQIRPHGDLLLASLLSRFLYIEDRCDDEYLQKYASEYEDFYELTQNIRIKATLDSIDVSLGQIGDLLAMTKDKKVAIVCGVGIQKYRDGADVLRAIDAFALMHGLFAKEGCGVAYLGNSKEGLESPFYTEAKRVSKVDTEFSKFKTVFIQGANPLSQMPNSLRVKESISKVENLIYFGLWENETSEVADLIIPAKNFLYKNDIRTSYSHNLISSMPKQKESEYGISEYDLTKFLCDEFDIKLHSEEYYLKYFKNFAVNKMDGSYYVEDREEIPYVDGFDTDDGEFIFLDDIDVSLASDDKLYLITPKSRISLNSQFKRENRVYLHSSLGFKDGDEVSISSEYGSVNLIVKINNDIRSDSVLIYSGTKGVNNLIPSYHSYEGKSAVFQDVKVTLL